MEIRSASINDIAREKRPKKSEQDWSVLKEGDERGQINCILK